MDGNGENQLHTRKTRRPINPNCIGRVVLKLDQGCSVPPCQANIVSFGNHRTRDHEFSVKRYADLTWKFCDKIRTEMVLTQVRPSRTDTSDPANKTYPSQSIFRSLGRMDPGPAGFNFAEKGRMPNAMAQKGRFNQNIQRHCSS